MKKKLSIILILSIGILMLCGGLAMFHYTKSKNKIDYADAIESYEGSASFQQKEGKPYTEFTYINTNKKHVIIKKVTLKIYKSGTEELLTEEILKPNLEVAPGKKTIIKFKELDKTLIELGEYYPEVTVE